MKAIILAAGRGSRLRPYTNSIPKALLPLGDTTLIHRNIVLLKEVGIQDISVVVGYLKEKFFEAFPSGIKFYVNEEYKETDQAGSLIKARGELCEDAIILTADLCCSGQVFRTIVKNPVSICLSIEKRTGPFDNTIEKILLENGKIVQIGKTNVSNEKAHGEFMGLTKLKRGKCTDFVQRLERLLQRDPKISLVAIFQQWLDEGEQISYIENTDSWCEVDDFAGLEKARGIIEKSTGAF